MIVMMMGMMNGDGVKNCNDICEGGDDNVDTDGDNIPDHCDDCDDDGDDDGDGVKNCNDICEGGDDNVDTDGDNIPDHCDDCDDGGDDDGDGVKNCNDICEGGDDNVDTDGDGIPDFCDIDEICDGIDNDGNGQIDEGLDCDTPPTGCETAYGRYEVSNSCFIDDGLGANRWGWTNYFANSGQYTMDLFAAAGQCDIAKGTKSGEVYVDYSNGMVTVTIELSPGFIMKETQMYIGGAPYPLGNNGRPTVASGQFQYKAEGLNNVTTYEFNPVNVSNFNDGLYIIVHAVTCYEGFTQVTKVAQTSVKAYPMTFKDELNLKIDISYASKLKIKMFDMDGRLVLKDDGKYVGIGTNHLNFNVSNLAPDMYIIIIDTEREQIVRKVLSRK